MYFQKKNLLLVNIGGSRIRIARFNGEELTQSLDQKSGNTMADLVSQIRLEMSKSTIPIDEIRVACPGLVRLDGSVGPALHSAVSNTHLKELLTKEFDVVTYIYNDAYVQATALPGINESAVFISIGTSIGGAILHDGRPIRGVRGYGGEVGHMLSSYAEGICSCGRKNCLDLIVSGWSLEKDLGKDWWKKPSKKTEIRIKMAGSAIAEINSQLLPVIDHDTLIVAGHITSYQDFREGIEHFDSCNSNIWPSVKTRFFPSLDSLTWTGLIRIF